MHTKAPFYYNEVDYTTTRELQDIAIDCIIIVGNIRKTRDSNIRHILIRNVNIIVDAKISKSSLGCSCITAGPGTRPL